MTTNPEASPLTPFGQTLHDLRQKIAHVIVTKVLQEDYDDIVEGYLDEILLAADAIIRLPAYALVAQTYHDNLAAAPVPPAGGEGDYSATVMTDEMFEQARAMRSMLDRLGVLNTRYISDGALAVELQRLLAARAQPPVGEVCGDCRGTGNVHCRPFPHGEPKNKHDLCKTCDGTGLAHPTEPAARDGGEAGFAACHKNGAHPDCHRCYRGEVPNMSDDSGLWAEMGAVAGGANEHGLRGWIELIEHHPDGRTVRREYVATDSPALAAGGEK